MAHSFIKQTKLKSITLIGLCFFVLSKKVEGKYHKTNKGANPIISKHLIMLKKRSFINKV